MATEGAVPLFLLIAIHLPMMITAAMLLAEGAAMPLRPLGRQLVTNPILLGIASACSARPAGAPVPGP